MIETIAFFWGLYALVTGILRVTPRLTFDGHLARLIGLCFMIPLPLVFFLLPRLREFIPQSDTRFFLFFLEIVLLLIFVFGSLIVGYFLTRNRT